MIEATLLVLAIGFFILLLRSSTRIDTEDSDELLGLFAYKKDKSEQVVSHRKKGKNDA